MKDSDNQEEYQGSGEKLFKQINEKQSTNYNLNRDEDQVDDIVKFKQLINKLGTTAIIVNRLDYYGNAIPLAALGNAIAFILNGFYRCRVYSNNDTFLWSIVLVFGGIAQITGGFLEFLKGRSFPTMLYLTLGFYCLTNYETTIIPMEFGLINIYGLYNSNLTLAFFYGAWMAVFIPTLISSFKVNLFYLIQCLATIAFFIIRCIGELFDIYSLKRHTSGILEAIAGFTSLYICLNQLINEQFRHQLLPSFPFNDSNEIDIIV